MLLVLYSSILIIYILWGNDKVLELKIATYGIIWGFILEITSTEISGFHSFRRPDFMGIPFWLPVSWGYGFVMAKRVSLIIYTNSPFTSKHIQ